MQTYLVGGAVRDELLGRPVRERDWVVVGATPDAMLRMGYRQVGRDFPVFLHPDTGEEHALARTERKTAPGHGGFEIQAGIEVTLEQDLHRRDLTINAMARDADGRLIDPVGGRRDLESRVLRHVGEAFREDPLRVFRAARFAAQLDGFEVHASTLSLMAEMVDTLTVLPAERLWAEFRKALAASAPQRFVETLEACGCLDHWFPELDGLQIDTRLDSARARYGGLGWGLGEVPSSRLAARLKVPNDYAELALQVARHGRVLADWRTVMPETLLAAGKSIGAFRNPSLCREVCNVVGVLTGRSLGDLDRLFARLAEEITASGFQREDLTGPALGQRIDEERIRYLAELRHEVLYASDATKEQ